jgi:hypothetical protein
LSLAEEELDVRDFADADMDERIDPAYPTSPRAAEAEKREVELLLNRLNALGTVDSKFTKFLSGLQEVTVDGRSVLVFTEYTDTMEYLRDQLTPLYGTTLGCYSGAGGQVWDGQAWVSVSKADITKQLTHGTLKALICTDAASEGLNLQAASAIVNYDLPWNPSKVEQRIGRIDRIGQRQAVLPIHNLFLDYSVDIRVYQALRERCGLFEHFVGRMQPVLALARDALRHNLQREEAGAFLTKLSKAAEEVVTDVAIAYTFIESEADSSHISEPPLTRHEIETALAWLAETSGSVSARQVKGQPRWRLRGLGKRTIEVTTRREMLERDKDVVPMTAGVDLLQQLIERLELPSRVPLVLAQYSSGACRCVEARWVEADNVIVIKSAKQLIQLIHSWNGTLASPSLIL